MNRILLLVIYFIIFISSINASDISLNKEEQEWIKNNTIIIGIEQWNPIISFNHNNSKIEGVSGEILNQIIKKLNLKTNIISANWNSLYADFKKQKINLLPATYYNDKKLKYGIYSKQYLEITNYIYTTNNQIKNFDSLKNKKIVTLINHKVTKQIKKDYPSIDIKSISSISKAVNMLHDGKVDALVGREIEINLYLKENSINNLSKISQNIIKPKPLYLLTNINQPILNNILQKGLDSLNNDEKVTEVIQKPKKKIIKQQKVITEIKNEDKDQRYLYLKYFVIFILFIMIVIFVKQYLLYFQNKNLKKLTFLKNEELESIALELKMSIDIISANVNYSKTDKNGVITYVSEEFCRVSGYSRKELIGHSHNIVRHPDTAPETFKKMWSIIQSSTIWRGQIKNKKKDGSSYWSQATVTPEYDKYHNIKGYISIRHDLTIKKELQALTDNLQDRVDAEVEKSKKIEGQLFQSEKLASMGEMIGNIAHQWRQPLSTISTASSGMMMQKEYDMLTDENFEKSCNLIVEHTDYLSKTIETFTNFIKENKEKEEIVLQENIDDSIRIIIASLNTAHIELINNINYTTPVKYSLVAGELSQVIINIINNAKDILVENDISLPSITIDLLTTENSILITIEDNAGGIPVDILPKIFEPYFTTKHQSQGTGLGLHMSYQIISQSLNGKLYAKNTSNGAKFFIELPIT